MTRPADLFRRKPVKITRGRRVDKFRNVNRTCKCIYAEKRA
jgi:hypothetical protein